MIGRDWWAKHREAFLFGLVGFTATCLIQLTWPL